MLTSPPLRVNVDRALFVATTFAVKVMLPLLQVPPSKLVLLPNIGSGGRFRDAANVGKAPVKATIQNPATKPIVGMFLRAEPLPLGSLRFSAIAFMEFFL
jgi:hypothetical protein